MITIFDDSDLSRIRRSILVFLSISLFLFATRANILATSIVGIQLQTELRVSNFNLTALCAIIQLFLAFRLYCAWKKDRALAGSSRDSAKKMVDEAQKYSDIAQQGKSECQRLHGAIETVGRNMTWFPDTLDQIVKLEASPATALAIEATQEIRIAVERIDAALDARVDRSNLGRRIQELLDYDEKTFNELSKLRNSSKFNEILHTAEGLRQFMEKVDTSDFSTAVHKANSIASGLVRFVSVESAESKVIFSIYGVFAVVSLCFCFLNLCKGAG